MICHLCQTETVDTVTSLEWEHNAYTVIGEVATLVNQMAVPLDPASVINLTSNQASPPNGDR